MENQRNVLPAKSRGCLRVMTWSHVGALVLFGYALGVTHGAGGFTLSTGIAAVLLVAVVAAGWLARRRFCKLPEIVEIMARVRASSPPADPS